MEIEKDEVGTFTYEGQDKWINFDSDEIPPCPKGFKAFLKLKDGRKINAPKKWRVMIWEWWHEARKEEITKDILLQASDDILSHGGRATKRAYKLRV